MKHLILLTPFLFAMSACDRDFDLQDNSDENTGVQTSPLTSYDGPEPVCCVAEDEQLICYVDESDDSR